MAWQTMVKELAPQDKTGSYNRPGYAFDNKIGSPQFPVSAFMLHCSQQRTDSDRAQGNMMTGM
jgi:hypothetical protein